MMHHSKTFLFAAMAISLAASGCSSTTDTASATTTTAAPAASSTAPASPDALVTLLPAPADTQQTNGPDTIPDGGIHMHYQITGSPNDVMAAYKSALEGKGWAVTTIVTSGGGSGGGGATYTGTHGSAYGVFDGGGYQDTTYIDVCTWAAKPANPNCTRGDR
ncbi:hypothetical protein [Mycolicibacterium mageritense]|uniref:hypothetical protein n=1 Tax=Mycolicibacterium mageritense TaxID=53462 RepID=UPI001E40233C|nr:hypothetical protein [Mycolicibacterium mageritense]